MSDAPALTVLYTAQLRGHLDRLPRLFSLIQRVRGTTSDPVLLVDLGGSCDPQVWECAATGGRATLFVLDAMGYDLACLSPEDSARLTDNALHKLVARVNMPVCGPARTGLPGYVTHQAGALRVTLAAAAVPLDVLPATTDVVVTPAAKGTPAKLSGRHLYLPSVAGDRLGTARLIFGDLDGSRQPVAVQAYEEAITPDLRVDATVAAAVSFVRDEVRQYQD